MEIRRLVMESEAAHPAAGQGGSGGITFSGGSSMQQGSGDATPRLLKRPSMLKRAAAG